MKTYKIDKTLKVSIFTCFVIYFLYIFASKKIYLYIHPRLIPVIALSTVIMILIIIWTIKYTPDETIKRKKKIKYKDYLLFLIPLVIIFFVEINTLKTIKKDNSIGANVKNIDRTSSENVANMSMRNSEKNNKLDILGTTINISSSNFLYSLNEILDNPHKYKDYSVNINGFVYRDETLKENEFVIGRYTMVCCAADMQVTGVICENNKNQIYDNYTWVKAKGKICTKISEGSEVAYLNLDTIDEDKNPDTSYVYPY